MPKAKSKKEQRFFWGVLVPQGKMSVSQAKKRSYKKQGFRNLPTYKRRSGRKKK